MKKDKPKPERKKIEIKQLIRVKIDISGLTEEDIQYLKEQSSKILSPDKMRSL